LPVPFAGRVDARSSVPGAPVLVQAGALVRILAFG